MAGMREGAEVSVETIYVALGETVKEHKSILTWAINNFRGKRLCIIHVHKPAQMIPMMGAMFPASSLRAQEVERYHEDKRLDMEKSLDEYLLICRLMGVEAEKQYIERDCIVKGTVELISLLGIQMLVMGSDKHHSKERIRLKSKKAIGVDLKAPASCHIWFVCKGKLIYTREGSSAGVGTHGASSSLQVSPNIDNGLPLRVRSSSMQASPNIDHGLPLRSQSVTLRLDNVVKLSNGSQDFRRGINSFDSHGRWGKVTELPSPASSTGLSNPRSSSATEGSSNTLDSLLRRSPSQDSNFSLCSYTSTTSGELEKRSDLMGTRPQFKKGLLHPSPHGVLDLTLDNTPYNHLPQAMVEAANSRREVEWTVRPEQAENIALEDEALETSHEKELKLKELEEGYAMLMEEVEKTKREQHEVMEELEMALRQKSSLESRVAASDQMVKDLEQRLQKYKKERDELRTERDNALKEAADLRRSQAESSNSHTFLDSLVEDWPLFQAENFADLVLRSSEMNRQRSPNVESEVSRIREQMRELCRQLLSVQLDSEERRQPPQHFICPISKSQEIMQDPHVAADGFTYEAEAMRGWLESGHDTSPCTNCQLANSKLIPNHTLRSAIQQWLQHN